MHRDVCHDHGACFTQRLRLRPAKCIFNPLSSCMETHMTKVLLWVVGVIFLIGLLVVFGVLDFIF